jgi:8-amino-7-oxononanoate synthase
MSSSVWRTFFTHELTALDLSQRTRVRKVVTYQDEKQSDFVHVHVDCRPMLAFCSNDYLGLTHHPELIAAAQKAALLYGVGSGSSPMVSGYSSETKALEQELAAFVGLPRALYFAAGFSTNVGLISSLVGPSDAVFIDKLSHASLIDGSLLSKARIATYAHCDMEHLETQLAKSSHKKKLVVSDAVFSMDGTIAPIKQLIALCDRFDALLLLDDAHGLGILGPNGQGALTAAGFVGRNAHPNVIYMSTFGKALGCAGAFVAGDSLLIELLLQKTRSYIFATAAPTMLSSVLRTSLSVVANAHTQRARLEQRIQQIKSGLPSIAAKHGWYVGESNTAIQPLIIGQSTHALAVMSYLEMRGIWVAAIRAPTVAENTARLRITLSSAHSQQDVDQLMVLLAEYRLSA